MAMDAERYDVLVIGQGYAGLTAAKLAVERGFRTGNLESTCMGGLILNVNELDPVPDGGEQAGAELASTLAMANLDQGVASLTGSVTAVLPGPNGDWLVQTDTGEYVAPQVIIASGARLRKLNIPGESEFFGQGVSECADCDGPMFRGMETVVVGGGDSAFQEALSLAQFAEKITMVMEGGPTAKTEWLERASGDAKISRLENATLVAIEGVPGKGVESVRVRTADQGETTLPASGVFVFVGLEPNTDFLSGDVARDPRGAVITEGGRVTTHPGLWAIGAVRSGYDGLLSDAVADAAQVVAALP